MVIHVALRASLAKRLSQVIVCTDSIEIAETCFTYGIEVCFTRDDHLNGTERIGEAAKELGLVDSDIVVDIQGDEPLVCPLAIDELIENFVSTDFPIMLPFILGGGEGSLNYVKLVESAGRVIYMSRADVPVAFRHDRKLKKHLSVIAFRSKVLQEFCAIAPTENELIESIELLRAIESGIAVGTFRSQYSSFSVDVEEDYQRAIRVMQTDTLFKSYRERIR